MLCLVATGSKRERGQRFEGMVSVHHQQALLLAFVNESRLEVTLLLTFRIPVRVCDCTYRYCISSHVVVFLLNSTAGNLLQSASPAV